MNIRNFSLALILLTGFACTSSTAIDEGSERRSVRGALEQPERQDTSKRDKGTSRGLVTDIEARTVDNDDFRRVIYTGPHLQLVLMSIPAEDHIGVETHPDVDQFFRVEEGTGEVMLGSVSKPVGPGSAVVVPAGTKHDIRTTGDKPLKLYTIYSPPHHRDGVVHHSRADAERDTEHFDGRTTE